MARPRSCQTKQPSQNADSDTGSTMSSQLTDRPCVWNSGAISQNRSIEADDQDADRHFLEGGAGALHAPRQQHEERHGEVHHDEQRRRPFASRSGGDA